MVQVTREDAPDILKSYLQEHGITQAFVAKKMGISPQSFNGHLNGYLKFDADFAIKVAKVLNISPSVFLNKNYSKTVD